METPSPVLPTVATTPEATSDRAARRVAGLADLLERRPELRGVHAPADAFEEAMRWAV